MATKKPVLDEEYPDLMEEARWWVNVSTTRSQSDRITTTLSASAAVKGGADVANLLSSDLQGPKQTLAPVNADQLTQMLALTNAPVANQGLAIYVYIYISLSMFIQSVCVFDSLSYLSGNTGASGTATANGNTSKGGKRRPKAKAKAKAVAQPVEPQTLDEQMDSACSFA